MRSGPTSSHSASSGTGRWLGTVTGVQSRRGVSACRSSWMASWMRSASRRLPMRFDLGRDEGDQADERQRPEPRPSPPPRVPARELGPAEGARAAEDGEDRGGSEQVAPEDRQARRREHAEGDERDHAGRGAEGHARAQEGERQQPASGGAEEDGLAQDLAQAPRHGPRDVARGPVMRCRRWAVSRVPVSECSGSPVTMRSPSAHSSGAAAASAHSRGSRTPPSHSQAR